MIGLPFFVLLNGPSHIRSIRRLKNAIMIISSCMLYKEKSIELEILFSSPHGLVKSKNSKNC
jgi:hypothetical protein